MRFYRAVSLDELADVRRSGVLRPGVMSCEGKHFACEREHAAQGGRSLYGDQKYAVLGVEIPDAVAAGLVRWDRLDGIGPACFATIEDLESTLSIEVLDEP